MIWTLRFHARVISIYKEFVYIDRYLVKYQLILYIFYSSICGKSARFRKQALYPFIFKYSHKKYMYNIHEQSENHHQCPVICQNTTVVLIGTLSNKRSMDSITYLSTASQRRTRFFFNMPHNHCFVPFQHSHVNGTCLIQ